MRILIVSDAWLPQVNGVVRTLHAIGGELRQAGHPVDVIGPDRFRSIPCPTYSEIRLALAPGRRLHRLIEDFAPDTIHIATEGPLGWSARRYCRRRGFAFTTSFHTRFPEYVAARFPVPTPLTYSVVRRFHGAAAVTMVATPGLRDELAERGFRRLALWTRGVDLDLFRPRAKRDPGRPRPYFLYVGRVAVEKNIAAFLAIDLPGTKIVVGDGPELAKLRREYPAVVFLGGKYERELAQLYADADVFVFPSLTDTFGNVLLEALASGVPVAAFPVRGPVDVIDDAAVGCLDRDLRAAALRALALDGAACRRFAERHSWQRSAEQFLANLVPLAAAGRAAA
jgi:glycosyltransferase involved in cell wall biosynthesis